MGAIAAPYIEKRNPYWPKHWSDGVLAGIAAGGAGYFRAVCKGDSIAQGQFQNSGGAIPAGYDYITDGFWYKFLALVRAQYGIADGGSWYGPLTHSKIVTPNYTTTNYVGGGGTGLEPISSPNTSLATSTASANGFWRLNQYSRVNVWAAVGDELVRFNAPSGTIKCDMVYGDFLTGAHSFKWNFGGTPGTGDSTVNLTGTNDGKPKLVNVYTGVASQSRLYVGNQDVANAASIYGFMAYKAANGLIDANLSYGGRSYAEANQISSTLKPTDKVRNLWSTDDGYTTFPRSPHLVILAMGTNDNNRNLPGLAYTPRQYGAALFAEITAIRRWSPNASVMIVLPWHSQDYDDQGNQVNNSSWPDYVASGRTVAEATCSGFVDFTDLMNPTPVASGYIGLDAHPFPLGYTYMASKMMEGMP